MASGSRATAPVGRQRGFDVRGACARVAMEARQVRIDAVAVDRLARALVATPAAAGPAWDPPHLGLGDAPAERVAGWVLLLDAMNFSFWQDEPRWRIEGRDGYMALAIALRRAADAGEPVGDVRHDASMSTQDLRRVLRGDAGGPELPPLFAERHATATSTAAWVVTEWGGAALTAARSAVDAFELAELLASRLPRFRDVAEWRGTRVPLLKRAQIAAFDLGIALGDEAPRLRERSRLTAFADYKLPQLLRAEGALVLEDGLAARVDAREEMTPGEEAEVELRALTVVAVDRLVELIRDRGIAVSAAELDSRLWWLAQGRTDLPPYHRVRTIWY
jgi:putative queuosine salvage protein